MARIAGINIPNEKKLTYALTYIYGVGLAVSKKIIAKSGLNGDARVKDLDENEIEKIRKIINNDFKVEGDLRLENTQNIKRLKEINCYRGLRHIKSLPCHGQRTKTNARTKRGKKVSMGSGRLAPSKKV